MVNSCCAINCTRRYKKGENVKFHRFPKNEVLRKKWIISVKRKDFIPSEWAVLCGDHFLQSDYERNVYGNLVLRNDSVPSVFNFPTHLLPKKSTRRVLLRNTEGTTSSSPSEEALVISHRLGDSEIISSHSDVVSVITSAPQSLVDSGELQSIPPTSKAEISQKNKRKNPVYVGDFIEEDLQSPTKRSKYWHISQDAISKYRKNCKYLQCKMKRREKKIGNLNMECIPEAEKQLIFRQLKIGDTSKKFPPELRSFALTVNFYSSSAYNYIRSTFGNACLPHPRTLMKWYQTVDGSPGYTREAIRAVSDKVQAEKEKGKSLTCGLLMDEMAIKEYVEWNGKSQVGYINYGTGIGNNDGLPKAKNALVFMLVALNARWKIPIGYFLIESLTAEEKANLVKGCLTLMSDTGVIIKSLTFDGCASNISMANVLGAKLYDPYIRPYFSHPTTEEAVHIFLDPCHMIKLCRNTLGDWGILHTHNGNKIKWDFFKQLVKIQNESGLHAATKIRQRHLDYVKEKMRVKLAVQTLSTSVADALDYCREMDIPEFQGSKATSEFCRNINNIFDILNIRNFLGRVPHKKALTKKSTEFLYKFVSESVQYLTSLRDKSGVLLTHSNRKTGFLGLIVSLVSMKNLFNDLIMKHDSPLDFLLTYKLSQDHLEMFLSSIRSRGGFNNNPTARQFEAAYKRLLVHTEVKSSDTASCLAQDESSILHISSNFSKSVNVIDSLCDDIPEVPVENLEALNMIQNSLYLCDVVAYIAGFVVKNISTVISCSVCLNCIQSDSSSSGLLNN